MRRRDRDTQPFPHLCYPEMYVIKGGFKDFLPAHRDLCTGDYVRMDDPAWTSQLMEETRRGRVSWAAYDEQPASARRESDSP